MTAISERIVQAHARGETVAVVTIVEGEGILPEQLGTRLVVPDVGEVVGELEDKVLEQQAIEQARAIIDMGRSGQRTAQQASGEPARLYVELIESPPWLIVVGAGHVAKPTAALGKMVGFRVTVLDDRPEFANWERFPEADEVISADFRLTLKDLIPQMHRQTYVVLVTRGHRQDEIALREVFYSRAGYIGMIGSRRRSKMVLEAMITDGYPRDQVRKIHSPIGLDIRAETPEEIAVSIISEIISVRRGGTARTLSGRPLIRAD